MLIARERLQRLRQSLACSCPRPLMHRVERAERLCRRERTIFDFKKVTGRGRAAFRYAAARGPASAALAGRRRNEVSSARGAGTVWGAPITINLLLPWSVRLAHA